MTTINTFTTAFEDAVTGLREYHAENTVAGNAAYAATCQSLRDAVEQKVGAFNADVYTTQAYYSRVRNVLESKLLAAKHSGYTLDHAVPDRITRRRSSEDASTNFEIIDDGASVHRTTGDCSLMIYNSAVFEPGAHLELKATQEGLIIKFWSEHLKASVPVVSATFGELAENAGVAAPDEPDLARKQLEAAYTIIEELLRSNESENVVVAQHIKETIEDCGEPQRLSVLRSIVRCFHETIEAIDTRLGLGVIPEREGDE